MAETANLPVTRDKIAKVFGDQRMIKWAEDLQRGVHTDLPELIDIAQSVASSAERAAAAARSSADAAQRTSDELSVLLNTARNQASAIQQIWQELAELRALLQAV